MKRGEGEWWGGKCVEGVSCSVPWALLLSQAIGQAASYKFKIGCYGRRSVNKISIVIREDYYCSYQRTIGSIENS